MYFNNKSNIVDIHPAEYKLNKDIADVVDMKK
jgi:hypothetical protein